MDSWVRKVQGILRKNKFDVFPTPTARDHFRCSFKRGGDNDDRNPLKTEHFEQLFLWWEEKVVGTEEVECATDIADVMCSISLRRNSKIKNSCASPSKTPLIVSYAMGTDATFQHPRQQEEVGTLTPCTVNGSNAARNINFDAEVEANMDISSQDTAPTQLSQNVESDVEADVKAGAGANMDIIPTQISFEQKTQIDSRLRSIDTQQLTEAIAFLGSPRNSTTEVVIEKYNIVMTEHSLKCLNNQAWLNDEVVNFYMSMLQQKDELLCAGDVLRVPSLFLNSFFISKLLEGKKYTFSNVER